MIIHALIVVKRITHRYLECTATEKFCRSIPDEYLKFIIWYFQMPMEIKIDRYKR